MGYGNYPELKDVKKILVIKLRHLGDVLLTSPIFTTLKRNFPNAKIHAYIYKEAFPMLDKHSCIDKIHVYDRGYKSKSLIKKLKYEFSLLRKIKKEKYDLVINLTEGDRGAIAASASRARIRVGIDPEKKGMHKKDKLYSHIVKNCSSPRHTVEKNLDALRRINLFPTSQDLDLEFVIDENAEKKVKDLLEKNGFLEKDYVLFHPSSRWRFKCWPQKKFSKLAKELIDDGFKIIITGGKDTYEKEMADAIAKDVSSEKLLNLSGQTSLKELGALIKKSKAIVCVDSVSLHMASALKAKTVVLFGPTSDINWGPWKNPSAKVISSNMSCRPCFMDGCGGSKISECLLQIQTDVVKQNLYSLLEKK